MIYPDYRVIIYIEEARRQDNLREAEISRLLRRGDIDRYSQDNLSRWVRKNLANVGHLLVAMGRRLECCEEATDTLSPRPRPRSRQPDEALAS